MMAPILIEGLPPLRSQRSHGPEGEFLFHGSLLSDELRGIDPAKRAQNADSQAGSRNLV
jgi:hypothetical protein